ncbi:hypothetical protein BCR44DRAFT_45846 [Catenaria anguillulae PL171]|uniref:CCHC-type domain-containing protein n=1 Tax=Catenaria anguillulae PL171 TaxID=765915 RepID=A0A1Y2H403_9FUNG|nr:hypothetical protein BCR44DRAFT_45846 [Catenaria anguillulae PL171]
MDAVALGELASNGHELRFFPGSAKLCYSCGERGHVKLACPSQPATAKVLPPSSRSCASAPTRGGFSYADVAKQAVDKVDTLDKDLRGKIDDLADKIMAMQGQMAKFMADQEALLMAFKSDVSKQVVARVDGLEKRLSATKEEVEGIEERLVSLASSVEGLLSGFQTLTKKFELMSDAINPALESTMEDVAELTAHRAKTSERYMRVNHDLAIVEVDLKVALDELRLYDDFEERLAAAREKSWAHQAKAQGSIAYPGLTLNKS